MHSHVVLKKQIVLLVENGDKLPNSTFNKACIWLIQPQKKKKRKGHAFDSLLESASDNEIIIVSKAKELNLARASEYIY